MSKTLGRIACEMFSDVEDEPDFWNIYVTPDQQKKWEAVAKAVAERCVQELEMIANQGDGSLKSDYADGFDNGWKGAVRRGTHKIRSLINGGEDA